MYLWHKTADANWVRAREEIFQARFGAALSIVSRANRKRLRIEIACSTRNEAQKLINEFGGRVEKLSRDWLKRFAREQKSKPLCVGKRLVVASSRSNGLRGVTASKQSLLVIPAGAAFGTGEHATTAMSLRLLEGLTRKWKPGWSIIDLGTGSGILALAAKRFGARQVWAVDHDVTAISTAKANAQINRIDSVSFRVADVCRWKLPAKIDVITANLFSELLIELLPKLKPANWLVLSGILRTQEKEFTRALRRNQIEIVEVRRRGKWIAIVAAPVIPSEARNLTIHHRMSGSPSMIRTSSASMRGPSLRSG